jgi:hypothetical protein
MMCKKEFDCKNELNVKKRLINGNIFSNGTAAFSICEYKGPFPRLNSPFIRPLSTFKGDNP